MTYTMTAAQHHAEAYRLDCDAGPYLEIEQHYQEAIRLDPENVRYRADWICYLLTNSRPLAADKAWEEAAVLHSREYKTLHYPVIRNAIESTRIYLAEQVLNDVPAEVKAQDPDWILVQWVLQLSLQADDQKLVFPDNIRIEDQWKGPHLSPMEHQGKPLDAWAAGQITCVDDKVVVRTGFLPNGADTPRFGWFGAKTEEFRQWCCPEFEPQVDDFVEFAWYGDADPVWAASVIRVHAKVPAEKNPWGMLPPIFPDPWRRLKTRKTD